MGDGVEVDVAAVAALAVDLRGAGVRGAAAARSVLGVHAARVKQGMREDFGGHKGLGGVPASINYDIRGMEVEVGADKAGQGRLANILAFGTSRHPASVDHTAAQRRELPATLSALADAAARVTLRDQ